MNLNKFKAFYQLNKARRQAQFDIIDSIHNEPIQQSLVESIVNSNIDKQYDDSLDQTFINSQIQKQIVHKKEQVKEVMKQFNHGRSQSCPYITPNIQQNLRNQYQKCVTKQSQHRYSMSKDVNNPENKKLRKLNTLKLPFAKRKNRSSLLSQSSQSVVIHNNLNNQLNIGSSHHLSSLLYSSKNPIQNKKPIQKISHSSRKTKYLKIKVEQQIKKYELHSDLKKLQKQSNDINVKQTVFESLMRKLDSQNKFLSGETNQSFIIVESL